MSKPKVSIGERIRLARSNASGGIGISQSELARLIGIKQPSLSQIESDTSEPRKTTLIAIARALNDDLGEEWLKEHVPQPEGDDLWQSAHPELSKLLVEIKSLSEKEIEEMRAVWEMVRGEIWRRKQIENKQKTLK